MQAWTFAALALAVPAAAQESEQAYVVDSGIVAPPQDSSAVTIGFLVDVPGATSTRLRFSDVQLGPGSVLRLMSLADGGLQIHTQRTIEEWKLGSAYFNGDRVWVEVLAQPGTSPSRVRLASVSTPLALPPAPTQCGTTDDRLPSSDPRVGRMQPSICTAFLVEHCGHPLLTAGHCAGGAYVVEFNTPPSSSIGNIVHPPPSDQYAVDDLSLQAEINGLGADWCVFGCFANPNTGKTPFEAQLAAFMPRNPPPFSPGVVLRVTGHGNDLTPPNRNFVQQSSTGPYVSHFGNVVRYQSDTESGNSGSPVILEATGEVIGIHTNGGCDAALTGSNAGTSLAKPELANALGSPLGVLSCTGTWSTYCSSQVNSQGCTPAIGATGTPRMNGGPGSFSIRAVGVLNQQSTILFYGHAPANTPFQGGALCVAGPLVRTPISSSGGNPAGLDCSGVALYDMGALLAAGLDPSLHAGATICAQFWQRDALASPPSRSCRHSAASVAIATMASHTPFGSRSSRNTAEPPVISSMPALR